MPQTFHVKPTLYTRRRVPKHLDRARLARAILKVLRAERHVTRTQASRIRDRVHTDDTYVCKACTVVKVVIAYNGMH